MNRERFVCFLASEGFINRERFVLSDTVWQKIEALLPGKKTDRGVTAKDNRLFLEAVLWRVRAGLPWRDLPPEFGHWNSVFTRFRRWVRAMVFERIFKALSGEPDFEYAMIDGTIVTVHQQASGAKGGAEKNAIGRSRGGLTSKIVALVDAWATSSASSCCRGSAMIPWELPRSSKASASMPCWATRRSTPIGCGRTSTIAAPPRSFRPDRTAR